MLGEIEKKAAMDFYGTREKKTYVFEYPEDYEKRLLAMGFQGTRDKLKEFPREWEKRAPMGFQGMRGKKSLFDEIEELEKRTIMGFQVICSIVKLYIYYTFHGKSENIHKIVYNFVIIITKRNE